jgi:hypothetical protein
VRAAVEVVRTCENTNKVSARHRASGGRRDPSAIHRVVFPHRTSLPGTTTLTFSVALAYGPMLLPMDPGMHMDTKPVKLCAFFLFQKFHHPVPICLQKISF